MAERRYWLFKSEPKSYSFSELLAEENRTDYWDGIRNYQVRNMMRDEIKAGDGVLFYHSSAKPTAVVGTARVVREAYPDFNAWDTNNKYYDPKSDPANPTWLMVDIRADQEFARPVTLQEIKQNPKLQDMMLVKRGVRLSVQPVSKEAWDEIVALGIGE